MKLRVRVSLDDYDRTEELEPFEFGVPYGVDQDDAGERMVDLLNTAVNWTDVVDALLRMHRGRLGILPEQIAMAEAQAKQQQQKQEEKQ